jgi:hypothetical protein
MSIYIRILGIASLLIVLSCVENSGSKGAIKKLELPMDLGNDTTAYNIHCRLKTRLYKNNLEYIFYAEYLKEQRPRIEYFSVELLDSSGFVVKEIKIESWDNIVDDSNEQIGFKEKNKISFYDSEEYLRIKSFDVAVSTKY